MYRKNIVPSHHLCLTILGFFPLHFCLRDILALIDSTANKNQNHNNASVDSQPFPESVSE